MGSRIGRYPGPRKRRRSHRPTPRQSPAATRQPAMPVSAKYDSLLFIPRRQRIRLRCAIGKHKICLTLFARLVCKCLASCSSFVISERAADGLFATRSPWGCAKRSRRNSLSIRAPRGHMAWPYPAAPSRFDRLGRSFSRSSKTLFLCRTAWSFGVPMSRQTPDPNRINAVRLRKHFPQPWARPGHPRRISALGWVLGIRPFRICSHAAPFTWMAGSSPAMTKTRCNICR